MKYKKYKLLGNETHIPTRGLSTLPNIQKFTKQKVNIHNTCYKSSFTIRITKLHIYWREIIQKTSKNASLQSLPPKFHFEKEGTLHGTHLHMRIKWLLVGNE
jgi:hypothetical protein